MRKNFSKAALMLVVFFVCGGFVSCSEQVNLDEPEKIEVPVPGPTQFVDRTKTIRQIIQDVFVGQTNKNGLEYRYNGMAARHASVTPAQKILYQPAEEQSEPTLEPKGDGLWIDSNGNEFTATEENYQLDSCVLNASIVGKEKMSLFRIHPQVAEVIADFSDEGMVTDQRTGKSAIFSMSIPNVSYFVADSTVRVQWKTETEIVIEHDTTYVIRDSIRTETITEYVSINREKNLAIINGFGYAELRFFRDGKTFVFRMDLDKTNILREENAWGIADKLSESLNGFELTDSQIGRYAVTKNGVNLESIMLQGVTFQKLNDIFKYATVTTKVAFSYTEDGEYVQEAYEVSASYFHELEVKAEPSVVTPDINPNPFTYNVDSVRSDVKDSEGHLIGQKMRLTITRNEDGKKWKIQYLAWETGLLNPTITGTQVGGNSLLRATSWGDSEYTAEGWSGTDTSREGFTIVASSKEYKFRTPFPKVPGFGGSEESVAESNIIFGTRSCTFIDPENTSYSFTISADGISSNETSVKIVEDQVGTDEAAKAEINARGLEYEYCGTHFLSVEQYVGGKLVLTQSRAEQLLYPKN